jgi:hypothetical protein
MLNYIRSTWSNNMEHSIRQFDSGGPSTNQGAVMSNGGVQLMPNRKGK